MPALDANPLFFTPANSLTSRSPRLLPGLTLAGIIAFLSIALGQIAWFRAHGLSAHTIAILLGIIFGNTAYESVSPACDAGVRFSKQTLLRLGIILYGFRLTFQEVGQVGYAGVVIDVLVLTSTFAIALLVGTKMLRLERDTVILIGAGSSICGAAAILATASLLRARTEQVTVAVSTVVLFGTLAIFLYPLLHQLNQHWHFVASSSAQFGVYIGSTVHEVAQVVASAKGIDQDAANAAVIAKMVRVMMLAPFLMLLSTYLARPCKSLRDADDTAPAGLAIPWFAFVFIATVGLNSLTRLPATLLTHAIELDTVLLATAMAALGLTTQISAIRRAGIRPLILASVLFCWLVGGGAAINRIVVGLLN